MQALERSVLRHCHSPGNSVLLSRQHGGDSRWQRPGGVFIRGRTAGTGQRPHLKSVGPGSPAGCFHLVCTCYRMSPAAQAGLGLRKAQEDLDGLSQP